MLHVFPFPFRYNKSRKEVFCVSDKEIALQLTLKLLDTGHFASGEVVSNEAYGKAAADIYNAVLNSIHHE